MSMASGLFQVVEGRNAIRRARPARDGAYGGGLRIPSHPLFGDFRTDQWFACILPEDRGIERLAAEDLEHHGPKEVEWQRSVIRIETRLIPSFAKIHAVVELAVPQVFILGIRMA